MSQNLPKNDFFACGGEQRMVNSTQELLCLLTNHRRRQNSRISSKKVKFFKKMHFVTIL